MLGPTAKTGSFSAAPSAGLRPSARKPLRLVAINPCASLKADGIDGDGLDPQQRVEGHVVPGCLELGLHSRALRLGPCDEDAHQAIASKKPGPARINSSRAASSPSISAVWALPVRAVA